LRRVTNQLRVWQDANGDGVTDAGELKTLAQAGMASLNLTAAQTDWASGGNHIAGFTTYSKTDGSNGWTADVGLGFEADGWQATVESNLVRATQSGGLVYGLSAGGALNLDLGNQGLDGAMRGNRADAVQDGRWRQPRLYLSSYRPGHPELPEFPLLMVANDPSHQAAP